MTLTALLDSGVLDPFPAPEDLALLHVPFGTLTGDDLEGETAAALSRGDRVALVGPTGSGKSSVVAALRQRRTHLFIRVPAVAQFTPEQLADPRTLTRAIVGALRDLAGDNPPRRPASRLSGAITAKVPNPIDPTTGILELGVAGEIDRQLTGADELYNGALADVLQRALNLIDADDASPDPVLLYDDTDRWTGASPTDTGSAVGFFRFLRWTADMLETPCVVAVHDRYLDDPDLGSLAQEPFNTTLRLPQLDRGQLGSLLHHRIGLLDGTDPDALLPKQSIDDAFARYAGDGSLRRMLQVVVGAARIAATEQLDHITPQAIHAAVADIWPSP